MLKPGDKVKYTWQENQDRNGVILATSKDGWAWVKWDDGEETDEQMSDIKEAK